MKTSMKDVIMLIALLVVCLLLIWIGYYLPPQAPIMPWGEILA